jgi:hypothetical protein
MSSEALGMVEAALFQLRNAIDNLDDQITAGQMRVAMSVLTAAVSAAKESLNAARVNDIAFAVNDLVGATESLSASDAAAVSPVLDMLRNDVETLRRATALKPALLEAVTAFSAKLRVRRSAIERQTYREGGTAEPLPHPPEELHADASMLQPLLSAAGFATPSLDAFCDDPASLRFHSISEIVDELDVILSG